MLNELLVIERGAREADFEMIQRHPDVKDGRSLPTLLVQLGSKGEVSDVQLVSEMITPWTLRDGQHNSFPFVQPKLPLFALDDKGRGREELTDKKNGSRRRAMILELLRVGEINPDAIQGWPGKKLLQRLHERRLQLQSLTGTPAEVVLAAIDRFLLACEPTNGGNSGRLLQQIVEHTVKNVKAAAQDAWLDVSVALLIGKNNPQKGRYENAGALVFDAAGYGAPIFDAAMAVAVSAALRSATGPESQEPKMGICALTGDKKAQLVSGTFPQPNVAVLGQTYLFAKNKDIPANDRYGRFAADALSIGRDAVIQLAAAFEALTSDERRGRTWRPIPGEAPKQSDLLLAFVHSSHDDPIVLEIMNDAEGDLSEEAESAPMDEVVKPRSVREYENKTQPAIAALRATDEARFNTKIDFVVFRKIDPANRKVVYSATTTVGALRFATDRWVTGERAVPDWLKLPVPRKKGEKPVLSPPQHVSPFGLIEFSKALFIRGGTRKEEVIGIPAAEALALYMDKVPNSACVAARRVRRVLHLVLARRSILLTETAHALRRGFDTAKDFDRKEALRTISVIGVLLNLLGSASSHDEAKDSIMQSKAFQLGQLLAAVDVLHVGYCADVRGGDVPPTLLGNQVFSIAQSSPKRAIQELGQRLAPYLAWATRAVRDQERIGRLANSKNRNESQRGWEIRKALRQARELRPIAKDLDQFLPEPPSNDADLFHARLVLGYMAGIPPREGPDGQLDDETQSQPIKEDE